MKYEYMLIKPDDDFCSNVDEFKSFLNSNRRIKVDEKHIIFSKTIFDYNIELSKVKGKKNKEIVFELCVSTESENVDKLEEFDSLLHRINSKYGDRFIINTISNDVSSYYAVMLYPYILEIENLLRKLIYRFMIKTVGTSWFGSTVPETVKNSIKNTAKKNKLDTIPVYDQLYLADFIQLGVFFFEEYTDKPVDGNAIFDLQRILEGSEDKKEELLTDYLDKLIPKSNWDRYFAGKINVENMYGKLEEVYKYRNCVAHAKRISSKDYKNAIALIDELKTAFEQSMELIDTIKMNNRDIENVQNLVYEIENRTFDRVDKEKTISRLRLYSLLLKGL